jgi:hypothetical protein
MRKVTVELKVKVLMVVDEGIEISEIVNGLDCQICDTTTAADIEDAEITGYEVIDSR